MPMDYSIDRRKNLVIFHGEGVVTDDDLRICENVRADPNVPETMSGLADMRGVTRVEVTGGGLNAMLEALQADTGAESNIRVAVLTGGEADIYIARLLEALATAQETTVRFRAFTDQAAAEAWLAES